MAPDDSSGLRRADALRNRERILEAASTLLAQSPSATFAEIAAAAGVSRSTLYRRFADRDELIAALEERPQEPGVAGRDDALPAGRLGRGRPVELDAIHVFDVVPPAVLPEQLVAEAERIAKVPIALYVLDIDGTHLLRLAGSERLADQLPAPLAIGPELDADGLAELRRHISAFPGAEAFPLWLRGRAIGLFVAFGRPARSLVEMARQAAAAITLADRYTDAFAQAQRRKQPKAAAEIQQSLLPPRVSRVTGGEVAGNVLPSYEVAGDWFDIVENADGVWVTLADGLGGATRATASSAVALGALRASRRSGAAMSEALVVMHQTLRELPGPRSEMTAVIARWDAATHALQVANCGHVAPLVIRADGTAERLETRATPGLGGRTSPKPSERSALLDAGDRLILVSDGVVKRGAGKAGLGFEGLMKAACRSERGSAADTVRKIHEAVLEASEGELDDDATAVCLAVG
ncbi:MAG TPA: PP2C family protein-serine/threonine phosphatase [Thermoleophilaceae bacterium]|nr:PP2C family protein-serine/threonine phosphatase [Thermoleophilaceae bacterium]